MSHRRSKKQEQNRDKMLLLDCNYFPHPRENSLHTILDSGDAVLNGWLAPKREGSTLKMLPV